MSFPSFPCTAPPLPKGHTHTPLDAAALVHPHACPAIRPGAANAAGGNTPHSVKASAPILCALPSPNTRTLHPLRPKCPTAGPHPRWGGTLQREESDGESAAGSPVRATPGSTLSSLYEQTLLQRSHSMFPSSLRAATRAATAVTATAAPDSVLGDETTSPLPLHLQPQPPAHFPSESLSAFARRVTAPVALVSILGNAAEPPAAPPLPQAPEHTASSLSSDSAAAPQPFANCVSVSLPETESAMPSVQPPSPATAAWLLPAGALPDASVDGTVSSELYGTADTASRSDARPTVSVSATESRDYTQSGAVSSLVVYTSKEVSTGTAARCDAPQLQPQPPTTMTPMTTAPETCAPVPPPFAAPRHLGFRSVLTAEDHQRHRDQKLLEMNQQQQQQHQRMSAVPRPSHFPTPPPSKRPGPHHRRSAQAQQTSTSKSKSSKMSSGMVPMVLPFNPFRHHGGGGGSASASVSVSAGGGIGGGNAPPRDASSYGSHPAFVFGRHASGGTTNAATAANCASGSSNNNNNNNNTNGSSVGGAADAPPAVVLLWTSAAIMCSGDAGWSLASVASDDTAHEATHAEGLQEEEEERGDSGRGSGGEAFVCTPASVAATTAYVNDTELTVSDLPMMAPAFSPNSSRVETAAEVAAAAADDMLTAGRSCHGHLRLGGGLGELPALAASAHDSQMLSLVR